MHVVGSVSRFTECLRTILDSEGGFVDDPTDHGGATNYGITQAVYGAWLVDHGQAARSVREITLDEAQAIYHARYWLPANCDNLPRPLDLLVFDLAVNSGVGRAVRMLQRVLHVDDDGVFGPRTYGALQDKGAALAVRNLLHARREWYVDIVKRDPPQIKFLSGWLNRLDAIREACA